MDMLSGLGSVYNNTYTNSTGNSLEDKLNNSDLSSATDNELMEVCKDFEQCFAEQMVKSMIKMSNVDGEDDENIYSSLFGMTDASDSAMGTMASYFGDELVSKVAETMTESNGGKGLGLAQILYEQMRRNYGIAETPVN